MSRRAWILGGLVLVLAFVNALVVQKELLLRDGRSVFLALAPRDPRSLIQGDYMVLDYQVSRDALDQVGEGAPAGRMVVRLDSRGIGTFVRLDDGAPLAADEVRLRYSFRGGRLGIGAEAFFFEEGTADRYEDAKFAELKVAPDGTSILVGLRGENLAPLP